MHVVPEICLASQTIHPFLSSNILWGYLIPASLQPVVLLFFGLRLACFFCSLGLHPATQVLQLPFEGDPLGHEDTSTVLEVLDAVLWCRLDDLLLLLNFCDNMISVMLSLFREFSGLLEEVERRRTAWNSCFVFKPAPYMEPTIATAAKAPVQITRFTVGVVAVRRGVEGGGGAGPRRMGRGGREDDGDAIVGL